MFPIDNTGQSFVGRLNYAIFVLIRYDEKCCFEWISILNYTELIENCPNVTSIQKIFCSPTVTHTIQFTDKTPISYFSGINIYFIDEVHRCTKWFKNVIQEEQYQLNNSMLVDFLNSTNCWKVMYFTRQQSLFVTFNSSADKHNNLVIGDMLPGRGHVHSNRVLFTSKNNLYNHQLIQFLNMVGYKINERQVLISVHDIKDFSKENSGLEVHYQCIGEAFGIPSMYMPDRTMVYLEVVITGSIVITNFIVICIFLRKEYQTPVTILLSTLAVSDTLAAVMHTVHFAISYQLYYHHIDYLDIMPVWYIFQYPSCIYYFIFEPCSYMFYSVSVLITMFLCVQKTCALRFPLWTRMTLNNKTSVICSVMVFIISFLGFTPVITMDVLSLADVDGKCCVVREVKSNMDSIISYFYIAGALINILAICVVIVCTIYITSKITCLRNNLPWIDNPVVKQRHRSSATTVVIICVIFFLSDIMNLYQVTQQVQIVDSLDQSIIKMYEEIKQYRVLSVFIGSSLNFIVYLLMSERLKQILITTIRTALRCKGT